MPAYCCVKGCLNKQGYNGYSMFGFPNDPHTKKLWVEAIKNDDWELKSHHRVCEVHFDPGLIYFVGSRKEVEKSAVPTLFCNCSYIKEISEIEAARTNSLYQKQQVRLEATSLDHSYSYLPDLSDELKKESNDTQNLKALTVKKKDVKHSPDCPVVREPLRPAPKSPGDAIKNTLEKTSLSYFASKPAQSLCGPFSNRVIKQESIVKQEKTDQQLLGLQLKTALEENAQLKKQLAMISGVLIPVTAIVPSSRGKLVKLKRLS